MNAAAELAARAEEAEGEGRFEEAGRLWAQVIQADPDHPRAVAMRGQRAIQQGAFRDALALFRQAEAGAPKDLSIKLQVAMALRALGDLHGALRALDEALAIQPYSLVALLSKGAVFEKLGLVRPAAETYRYALEVAPEEAAVPPGLRAPLAHAREVVDQDRGGLEEFLRSSLEETYAGVPAQERRRFDECLDVFVGKKKVFVQQPDLVHFPQLPAIQFYDRSYFPWLEELEAATDIVRAEMLKARGGAEAQFKPYIALDADKPVNQWAELNHSDRWATFFLWKDGRKYEENCALCPGTAELLSRIPMAVQEGYGPTAMFSVLQPKTRIPPHVGSANTRLICHLPLVLPGQCGFRVGNEVREWVMGEAFVFDDTIEHEAWNDSDEERVVLIIDVWNPLLTQTERRLVDIMMAAYKRYLRQG